MTAKKLSLFLISFFLLFSISAGETPPRLELKAYGKSSAIAIDGALVEKVWEDIEPERLLPAGAVTGELAHKKGEILFRAVYEADYIALALAFCSTENFALPEKMKEHEKDLSTITLSSPEHPAHTIEVTISPKGILKERCSGPYRVQGAVWPIKKWFFAEIRFPIPAKDFYYGKGQNYELKIRREIRDGKNKKSLYNWNAKLHCSKTVLVLREKPSPRKVWRNGNFNTFFKRPNRKWAPNWDLGKGDHMQQGWNLNKAEKGIPHFEVMFHPRKNKEEELDCYVLLKNGDFYQIYKGRERHLAYSFKAKGEGRLNVYFYRFSKGIYAKFMGRIPVMTLNLNSDRWKNYQGRITKPTSRERLALAFETENSRIYLEDAEVKGISGK